MLARRHSEDAASNPCRELAYFVTTGIVISPYTTTTTTVITGGACGFVLTANAIMFLTILGFFITFDGDDVQYSVW